MGQNAFLKLDGIKGNVKDTGFKDCIEISNFSFHVSNKEDALLKTEERLEGATIGSISISKKIDKSSSKLIETACKNEDLGTSYVYFCRPKCDLNSTTGLEAYMTFTMESTSIENYNLNGGAGYPTETLSLQFTSLAWDLKDEDGKSVGSGKYVRPDSKLEG